MVDQEDDPYLYDEWYTANQRLTCFNKDRDQILVRSKGTDYPSVQGPASPE